MNLSYKHLLPEEFVPQSRVWIYQSNRLFTLGEALELEEQISSFCDQWTSHGADVKAYGNLFFGQFVVLIADESQAGVSGCSTDSSVRFIKSLEQQYGVDFFNRSNLAFVIKDKIELLPLNQLNYGFEHGFITQDTLYFNNLVLNLEELRSRWIIPIKDSWLATRLMIKSS
jgi:hypothetical protein